LEVANDEAGSEGIGDRRSARHRVLRDRFIGGTNRALEFPFAQPKQRISCMIVAR